MVRKIAISLVSQFIAAYLFKTCRFLLLSFGALCLALSTFAEAQQRLPRKAEIVQLAPRPDVLMRYLLIYEQVATPKAVAVLFAGGDGLLKLRGEGENIQFNLAGNFLVKSRGYFRDDETAIALVDAPSDQINFGFDVNFRKSKEHAADIQSIVDDLRKRFSGAKVFLIGTSAGTVSAANVGMQLAGAVDGVILTSSAVEWGPVKWGRMSGSYLNGFDFDLIKAPPLFVHHVGDICVVSTFASVKKYMDKFPFIAVLGGDPASDDGCGAQGPHGFLGREKDVVSEIKNWMHSRPYRKEIP